MLERDPKERDRSPCQSSAGRGPPVSRFRIGGSESPFRILEKYGGDEEIRTPDLLSAIQVVCHTSVRSAPRPTLPSTVFLFLPRPAHWLVFLRGIARG